MSIRLRLDDYAAVGPVTGKAPCVGDPVTWVPSAFVKFADQSAMWAIKGQVIYVNEAHRYYTVEGDCNGVAMRESFKF